MMKPQAIRITVLHSVQNGKDFPLGENVPCAALTRINAAENHRGKSAENFFFQKLSAFFVLSIYNLFESVFIYYLNRSAGE